MEPVSFSDLLTADETRIRTALRADAVIDQNRRQSVERLREELGRILLRCNADSADPARQALAGCLLAPVRDMLELLEAGVAEKETEKRAVRAGAAMALLTAVILALLAALLVRRYFTAGCVCAAAAVACAFAAGRLWYGERQVRVHAGLDPDIVWRTLRKTAQTMDQKLAEYLAREQALRQTQQRAGEPVRLEPEDWTLFGDLLEASCAGNGDYALRQLGKVEPWLRRHGVQTAAYGPDTAELFELLPTKNQSATLRPALLLDGRLLLAGRATEHVDAQRGNGGTQA